MPDGSSSAAPVMRPGPSDLNSNRIHRTGAKVGTNESWSVYLPANRSANPFTILHGRASSQRSNGIQHPCWPLPTVLLPFKCERFGSDGHITYRIRLDRKS